MIAAVDPAAVKRFSDCLDLLAGADDRIGIAVSGGPDSLALLLLASTARPGTVAAATVDHGLRATSDAEAKFVRSVCKDLGVPHDILRPDWQERPTTAIQEKARHARYEALGRWASASAISSVLTAHHAEDQLETLVMRLARGSGVTGLAAMRAKAPFPDRPAVQLVRPLLSWRKAALEELCWRSGLTPIQDPSNLDPAYERVRLRRDLAMLGWLDPAAAARTATRLAQADEAVTWAVDREWSAAVTTDENQVRYRPTGPAEVLRRIVARAVDALATEGAGPARGAELDRLVNILANGGTATLRGVRCSGGETWQFENAPPRRLREDMTSR